MGMKDVSQELGGYSALLEMSSNPGLQVVGKRLGELADQITKEQQAPERSAVCRGVQMMGRGRRLGETADALAKEQAPPVNPAPTPDAVLLKDMADWWESRRNKPFSLELHAELTKFTHRAYCIVQS